MQCNELCATPIPSTLTHQQVTHCKNTYTSTPDHQVVVVVRTLYYFTNIYTITTPATIHCNTHTCMPNHQVVVVVRTVDHFTNINTITTLAATHCNTYIPDHQVMVAERTLYHFNNITPKPRWLPFTVTSTHAHQAIRWWL